MSSLLWMLLKQGTGKERRERGRSGGLRRSAGSGEGARGAEKERGELRRSAGSGEGAWGRGN